MWTLEACCLVVERSSLGSINPEWNAIKRSYFHWIIICVCKWSLNFESVKNLIEIYLVFNGLREIHATA